MSFSIIFIVTLSCFCSMLGNCTSGVNYKYEGLRINSLLVLDIQKFYESRTVFIVYSDTGESIQTTTIMLNLLREFSKGQVFSMTMNYTEMLRYEKYYQQKIGQPLYVVFLHNMKQVERFQRITRHYYISYPIWLLIFSPDLAEVCDRPKINYFHVKFDTRMLVKCPKEATIREWYSIDEKGMRYQDFALWDHTKSSLEERLYLKVNVGLYNRRNDLEGSVLKIATIKDSSFITARKGHLSGFFATILTELSSVLNFTISHKYEENIYGAWDNRSGRYNGVIGLLESRQVDLGVAAFTMTGPRLDVVDFTNPIMVSKNYLYIKKPDKSYLLWFSYFKVYSLSGWLALHGLFYLSLGIVTIIQIVSKEKPIPPNFISENFISLWGIYCQQCLPDFPTAMPSRIAYFSILSTSVILLSVYSACLVSYLTLTPQIVLFNDFAEFARDGTYQLIAFCNSSDYDLFATSNDRLLTDMSKLMRSPEYLPMTMMAGFSQVCESRVAFYSTEAVMSPVTERIPCDIGVVKSGTIGSLGITLTKRNQYKGIIDYFLKRFRDHGIMTKLRLDVYKKVTKPPDKFLPVPMNGVAVLFIIFGAGTCLSLVLLVVELVVCHYKNHSQIDRKIMPMYNNDYVAATKNSTI